MDGAEEDGPLFNAVSSSARQLFLLLRCISFAQKAQVQITQEGLRFSVEDASVMEGYAFLDRSLFTTFEYNVSSGSSPASDEPPTFDIDLPSLLETLQIFGLSTEQSNPYSSTANITAFNDPRVLGISGTCTLTYEDLSSSLVVTLSEPNITTNCSLTTYESEHTEDLPFDRDNIQLKLIMRSSWLNDAISELAASTPDILTLTASSTAPYFSLSASGHLGSTTVSFTSNEKALLETLMVNAPGGRGSKIIYSYKFSHVRAAHRAMACATKVSIRGDDQGVLNMQFMIEVEAGKVSFVDFRFVPLVDGDAGDENEDEDEDEEQTNGASEEESETFNEDDTE